jgi:uncharacterized protein
MWLKAKTDKHPPGTSSKKRVMKMALTKKDMSRSDWPRVTEKAYAHMLVNEEDFSGAAGLLYLKSVKDPLVVTPYSGKSLIIADKGYYWLQFAPENRDYWLTVMFDCTEDIIEFYFDITDGNVITDNGQSWSYDLFLDVVLLPDGSKFLLDEDELRQALQKNEITKEQFDKAYLCADSIMKEFGGHITELTDFCVRHFRVLEQRILLEQGE